MTITVPTGDFVGILADVIPLASQETEFPAINSVRLEWDGELMHAVATDRYRIGISSWHADDEPEGETQDDLFTTFGGTDDEWSVLLPLDDAKHLVKVFKLGPKEGRTPLTVEYHGGAITVARSRDTGYSALQARVEGRMDEFPDVRKLMADSDKVEAVKGLAFNARFLADFGKARQRGPLEFTFTGDRGLAHVLIGKRFTGAIMPVRLGDEVAA